MKILSFLASLCQRELPVCVLVPKVHIPDGWRGRDLGGWGWGGRRDRRGWNGGRDDGRVMKIGFWVSPFPPISALSFCGHLHFHIIIMKNTRVTITNLQLCSCNRRVSSGLCKVFCLTFTPLIPIALVVPRMLPFPFFHTHLFHLDIKKIEL